MFIEYQQDFHFDNLEADEQVADKQQVITLNKDNAKKGILQKIFAKEKMGFDDGPTCELIGSDDGNA